VLKKKKKRKYGMRQKDHQSRADGGIRDKLITFVERLLERLPPDPTREVDEELGAVGRRQQQRARRAQRARRHQAVAQPAACGARHRREVDGNQRVEGAAVRPHLIQHDVVASALAGGLGLQPGAYSRPLFGST